jgi:magnesium-transporting ATPase (P-type)
MSTAHDAPEGPLVCCKGAAESVLSVASRVLAGDGPAPLTADMRARITAAEDSLAEQGLRVLALAYRPLGDDAPSAPAESDLVLVGLVGFEDPPRPGVAEAVRKAEAAGIKVIVASGDHPRTTVAIARGIGLVGEAAPVVVTGDQIEEMSQAQLQIRLDAAPIIFARLRADQKLKLVRALRGKGHTVAVTGDGVNDAPALKQADIGIAMGRSGSDVAREAADMILVEDNFANIVDAVEEGRAVFDNVRKFMTYVLASNVPEIVPYLAFALLRIPLPLTIIQILAIDLGTDMLPAIALGAERADPAAMRRPPRPRGERLLSWRLLARAYLFLGPIEAAAAMAAYFAVLGAAGWTMGTPLDALDPLYREATTACFGAIVATQVANVFLCRSDRGSVARRGVFDNKLIVLGVAVEIGLTLLIVYTGWGNAVFGTAPLALETWLFMLPFAAAMLVAEEGRKWIVRRPSRTSTAMSA